MTKTKAEIDNMVELHHKLGRDLSATAEAVDWCKPTTRKYLVQRGEWWQGRSFKPYQRGGTKRKQPNAFSIEQTQRIEDLYEPTEGNASEAARRLAFGSKQSVINVWRRKGYRIRSRAGV